MYVMEDRFAGKLSLVDHLCMFFLPLPPNLKDRKKRKEEMRKNVKKKMKKTTEE